MEQRTVSYNAGGSVSLYHLGNIWQYFIKLNMLILRPFSRYIPNRNACTYPSKDMHKTVHSNTVHNRQNLNTKQRLSCSGVSRCVTVHGKGRKPHGFTPHA